MVNDLVKNVVNGRRTVRISLTSSHSIPARSIPTFSINKSEEEVEFMLLEREE